MISKRNIAIIGLVTCLASYASNSYAATINVNTTDMTIDVTGNTDFIDLDTSATPAGRSGLYKPDSITIEDLEDISKNPADSNTGAEPAISLPEAIIAANNTPGADLIILQANEAPYTLSTIHNYWYGANALPPITSNITIRGDGLPDGERPKQTDKAAVIERDSNADPMRLFFVMGGSYTTPVTEKAQVGQGALTLLNLHIKGGHAKGGNGSGGGAGLGGAIFNQGFLSINGVTFSNNTAQGGNGSSTAGLGGGGVGGNGIANLGGGFFNTAFIGSENDITTDNITKSIFGGNGGQNGSGGFGPLNDNGVNGGGPAASNSTHTSLGAFGAGGGRAANSSTEDGNAGAFGSGGGYGTTGGPGGFGGGGGQSSSASNESIAGFAGGKGTSVRGGGGAGLGGAIFNHTGISLITNSTFSNNQVIGGEGDFGGSAYGAAIFSANAQSFNGLNGLNIYHSTIFDNTCSAGTGTNTSGVCNSPVYTLGIIGTGAQDGNVDATATITNSIIANPESVSYSTLSNNKSGNNSGSTLTLSGKNIVRQTIFNGIDAVLNQVSADTFDLAPFPNSETLNESTGLTPAILPISGSPAIDGVAAVPIDSFSFTPALFPSDPVVLAIRGGFSNLSLGQHRKPRFKAFIETPAAPATSTTPLIAEVIELLPTNIGAIETAVNTAPEIIFQAKDENGNEINPKVPDNSFIQLSSLFTIRDLDDPFNTSSLDMQLDLAITGGTGTFEISTADIIAIREAGLEFVSVPTFSVSSGTEPPPTVSLSSISIKAPLRTILSVLRATIFEPTTTLGGGINDQSEIDITIDDLGIVGGSLSPSLTDSKTLTIDIIGTPPEVEITNIPTIAGNTSFPLIVVFREEVDGFDISDIEVRNGSIITSIRQLSDEEEFLIFGRIDLYAFQVNIQANGQGDIQIEIPAGVAEDPIGLKNTASNIVTVKYDNDKPNISTSGIPATAGSDEFTARFIFDEDVSGFTIEDIQITNGTLSDFEEIDGRTYSVVVTPDLISGIRYSIKEDIASDAAGNGNKALNEKLIPLQVGGSGSGSSYNPLFSLIILILFALRRRINP